MPTGAAKKTEGLQYFEPKGNDLLCSPGKLLTPIRQITLPHTDLFEPAVPIRLVEWCPYEQVSRSAPCGNRESRPQKALRTSKAEVRHGFPPVRYSQGRSLVSDDLKKAPALQGVLH